MSNDAGIETIKTGLSLTKRLHHEVTQIPDIPDESSKRLKSMIVDANKLFVKLRRQIFETLNETDVCVTVLKQVLKEEMIDREANAARVSDRQRLAAERGMGVSDLAQRSEEAVTQINNSLASLCPWQISVSPNVSMIAAQHDLHQSGRTRDCGGGRARHTANVASQQDTRIHA